MNNTCTYTSILLKIKTVNIYSQEKGLVTKHFRQVRSTSLEMSTRLKKDSCQVTRSYLDIISKEHPVSGGGGVSRSRFNVLTLFEESTTVCDEASIFKEINMHTVPPTYIYRMFFNTYPYLEHVSALQLFYGSF